MRTSLLPGLTDALKRNLARQQSRVRLFEIGRSFHAAADATAPVETIRIAAVATGAATPEHWDAPARAVDVYDLKGDLDSLAACAGASLTYVPDAPAWGHPGRSATLMRDGHPVGWIGELHPRLARALELDAVVVAFELDLTALQARPLPRLVALSKFPAVRRDLAILVPDTTPWEAISRTITHAAGTHLAELRLFDRYQGAGIEPGSKSLGIGLIFQEKARTLTDSDVEAQVAAIMTALASEHGARLRT